MAKIEIRTATLEDAAAIAALSAQLGYASSRGRIERRLNALSKSGDHAVFVACTPGSGVVGWVHVFQTQRVESDAFSELGGFVVAESCHGRGIGRSLLAAAEKWVKARGVATLRVRSRSSRSGAHAFYERMGFSLVKEQHVYDKSLGPIA